MLHRIGLSGATDVTVGGLPALSSPGGGGNGESARVYVGLPDGGILMVEVETDAGVVGPETAARALAEAILVTGPLTAHATPMSTAEPIGPAGSPCELVTLDELRQITGQRFADGKLDTNRVRCDYRARDRKALVSLSIGAADLGVLRSKDTRNLKVSDREAVFSPATKFLLVDLGAGRTLGVKIQSAGKGVKAKAIAETAIGRMIPGPITCPLISTDMVESASGLDLQPIATEGPALVLVRHPRRADRVGPEIVSAERPDLPTVRASHKAQLSRPADTYRPRSVGAPFRLYHGCERHRARRGPRRVGRPGRQGPRHRTGRRPPVRDRSAGDAGVRRSPGAGRI